GGVTEVAEIHHSARDHDVNESGHKLGFPPESIIIVFGCYGSHNQQVLQRETGSGVIENALPARCQRMTDLQQLKIPPAHAPEIKVQDLPVFFGLCQSDGSVVVSDPFVKSSADKVKVARGSISAPFTDCLRVIATQPGFDEIRIGIRFSICEFHN